MKTEPMEALAKFIKFLQRFGDKNEILFRGQRTDQPLIPKLGRVAPRDDKGLPALERRMMDAFKRQALPFIRREPTSEWDWLCIAQHYGLATRLLDWTQNPLAALWFAVRAPADGTKPGVVWAFDPVDADYIRHPSKQSPYTIDRTRVFRPRHIAPRVSAQSGWFTAHKYLAKERRFVPLEKNALYASRLAKFSIASTEFPNLRADLDRCGINAATLLADLDGLSESILWQETLLGDEKREE